MATSSSSRSSGKWSETPGDLILHSLEDLGEYNFKKLRNKLSDYSHDEKTIPRGRLENADPVDTKVLLVDTYEEEGALDVVTEVLPLIGLQGPASKLQEKRGQSAKRRKTENDTRLADLKTQHMKKVREKFLQIKEHNSRMGEPVNLKKQYFPLVMMKGYPDIKEKLCEITAHGIVYIHTVKERSDDLTSLHTLFDPDKDGVIPKVVVLHGPAGIGKTWTSQKIMLDWASGNLYQDKFDFVFYLSFRDFNTITGPESTQTSLVRLLSIICSLQSPADLVFILKDYRNHGRLLFVIDGFDELRWTLVEDTEACYDFSKETHKETLLRSLLRKQLLEQCSLVITTRSLAQEKLKALIGDSRYIEIKGFSSQDRRKYFHDSFENEVDAEKALRVVEEDGNLRRMCAAPIMCWIMCTTLRQEIKEGLNLLQYKSITSLYLVYLTGLVIYHGKEQTAKISACLKKICALANDGVLNQQFLFKEKDLKRHGLSLSEVESLFLNENIFQVSIINQTYFSFVHRSVQEFLTALHYVLDDGDEEGASGERAEVTLPEICKGGSLLELCLQYSHLFEAILFLSTLLKDNQLSQFSEMTGIKTSLRVTSAVEEWIAGHTNRSVLEQCRTDIHQSSFSENAIPCPYKAEDIYLKWGPFFRYPYLKLDTLWQLVFWNKNDVAQLCDCLRLCECPKNLTVSGKTIYSEDHETFSPFLHRCHQLCFFQCHFLHGRNKRLLEMVTKFSQLSEIDFAVGGIQISSSDGSYNPEVDKEDSFSSDNEPDSLPWLINPESKIQELSFKYCDLSPLCIDNLASVLITNGSISKLTLSQNLLEDSGVKRLCEGLKDQRCTLQELSLEACDLSPLCCEDLRSALITSRSLIKLNLSGNDLEESGVKLLCEGLKDPGCALKELSLRKCDLSPLCCDDLRSALYTNRSLTKLDLTSNPLGDSGVKILCEALREPDCTLQELSLQSCKLSHGGCDGLCSALVTNRSLINLDLSWNWNIQDSGVNRLCEGLRDPRCTLQELRMIECGGTSLCCEDLYSVISTSQTLTYLKITLYNYGQIIADSNVNSGCERLRRLGANVEKECHTWVKGIKVTRIEAIYKKNCSTGAECYHGNSPDMNPK